MRAQDEHQPDRAHRQAPDERGHERRGSARLRAARRRSRDGTQSGWTSLSSASPVRPSDQKRFGRGPNHRDTERGDRLPLQPRGPAPHALRDLAAVRAAGERVGAARPRRALRAPALGARGARAARGLRLRAARRAVPRPRLRARLLRAAAALAAARCRRGARARARDRPGADAARARLALRRRRAGRGAAAGRTTWPRGIDTLVDTMSGYWERALEPWWDHRARAARGGHPPPRRAARRGRRARAVRGAPRRRALALRHARGRGGRRRGRGAGAGAGCSSCPRCSCGRAPARCSTRRGSRA